jgi:tetratricopeptide (TPR) repeat protein
LPALERQGAQVRRSDVVIRHVGYQDPALRRRKLERDLRLLLLEDADRPGKPYTLCHLGEALLHLGRPGEAVAALRRSLDQSAAGQAFGAKVYYLLAQGNRQMGRLAEAVEACREGRSACPGDADLLFQQALALNDLGQLEGAEACLRSLLVQQPMETDVGSWLYRARHNLALVCSRQGRVAEAEALWREVTAERQDFGPAWQALGHLWLSQGRGVELEETARRLEGQPGGRETALLLRAQWHIDRQEFLEARRLLEKAVATAPQSAWPRMVLALALVHEGDLTAAELAFHNVLALEPGNVDARRHLERLRQRQTPGAIVVRPW